MRKPDYASTKKWIFESEEFLQMAFIIGVAYGKKLLKEDLKIKWKTFLLYYMPEIYKADRFTSYEYKRVCDFIDEMQKWAVVFKEALPEYILEAEGAAPEEKWKSPISFEEWREKTWDFEVKW